MQIKVRGIHRVTVNKKTYLYHRRSRTRILELEGSAAFLARVEELDRNVSQGEPKPGSLGGLIAAYRASPEFSVLADRTRKDYQRVFDYLQPGADMRIIDIDSSTVIQMRDDAFMLRKRRFANYLLSVLSLLFNWGKPRTWTDGNPAQDVPKIKRPRDARVVNRAWADRELEVVLENAKPELRLPISIGAYAGLREGDALRLPWAAYDGQAIEFRQGKTGDVLWIPVHSTLKGILDAAPRVSPVIVVGARGCPYTGDGFRTQFFKLIRKLEMENKVGPGLTFHGLRHTVGKRLADAGCDDRIIMSITGHRSTSMVQTYTREADQKRRAAEGIRKLERRENEARTKM